MDGSPAHARYTPAGRAHRGKVPLRSPATLRKNTSCASLPNEDGEVTIEPFQSLSLRKSLDSYAVLQNAQAAEVPAASKGKEDASPAKPQPTGADSPFSTSSRFSPPSRKSKFRSSGPGVPTSEQEDLRICLQRRAVRLKGEIDTCEEEVQTLRHRLSRAHSALQSKEQRRVHWETQACRKDWGDVDDVGPGAGPCLFAWQAFLDRSASEVQKIRRILPKDPGREIEAYAAHRAELSTALAEAQEQLQSTKSEMEQDEAEISKLTRVLRSREVAATRTGARHRFEVDAIWAEIARSEREESRLRQEEMAEQSTEKKLRQEVRVERGKIEACSHRVANERLQEAEEAVDLMCMRIEELKSDTTERQARMSREHTSEVSALELACEEMKAEVASAVEEAEAAKREVNDYKRSLQEARNKDTEGVRKMVRDAKQEAAKLRNSFAADRRQELAAEQNRLEAVQRIQCQVRGWQGRKTAKAKRSRDKKKASLATERREKLLQPPPPGVRRTYRAPNIGADPAASFCKVANGSSSPNPDRRHDSATPSRSEADPPPEPEPDETTESPGHPTQSTPCIDSSEGPTHVGSEAGDRADVLSQPRSPSRSPPPSEGAPQSRSRSPSRASDSEPGSSRELSPTPEERDEHSASGSATSSKSQRPSKRSTGHQRKKESSRDSATLSSRSSERSPSRSPSPSPRSMDDAQSEVPSLGSAD